MEAVWSEYLLHFSVDTLTHLRPAMSDQDRTVFIDVDQSSSLLYTNKHDKKIKIKNKDDKNICGNLQFFADVVKSIKQNNINVFIILCLYFQANPHKGAY